MNERIREFAEEAGFNPVSYMGSNLILFEKFAELVLRDYAKQLMMNHMYNSEYAKAMDQYYEQKWAHRFD